MDSSIETFCLQVLRSDLLFGLVTARCFSEARDQTAFKVAILLKSPAHGETMLQSCPNRREQGVGIKEKIFGFCLFVQT